MSDKEDEIDRLIKVEQEKSERLLEQLERIIQELKLTNKDYLKISSKMDLLLKGQDRERRMRGAVEEENKFLREALSKLSNEGKNPDTKK
jgi:GTPase involved in cell partitioning and DNA repair